MPTRHAVDPRALAATPRAAAQDHRWFHLAVLTRRADLNHAYLCPGYLRIAALETCPNIEVRSNVVEIEIEIEEPTGFDQAARTYIEATGAARYFLTGYLPDNLVSAFCRVRRALRRHCVRRVCEFGSRWTEAA